MINQTYISVFVVALIVLYWFKKRPQLAAKKCANIWNEIKNPSAKSFFYNALSLSENDPDLKHRMYTTSEATQQNIDYTRCVWAANYVLEKNRITEGEYQKMDACLYQKFI